MCPPLVNGDNSENGLNLWLGGGVCPPVEMVKIEKMVWPCGWDEGCVPLVKIDENSEYGLDLWLGVG